MNDSRGGSQTGTFNLGPDLYPLANNKDLNAYVDLPNDDYNENELPDEENLDILEEGMADSEQELDLSIEE